MKTFLEYLTESKSKKPAKRYKGTPVVVSTHGSHSSSGKKKKPRGKKLNEREEKTLSVQKPRKHRSHDEWLSANDNTHIGTRSDEIDQAVSSAHPYKVIPNKSTIKKYTRDSTELNLGLLDHYNEGRRPDNRLFDHDLTKLDKAVNHHKLKHDLHVYSGVGFHPGEEAAKDPEGKLHLPAYTSASIDKAVAHRFASIDYGDPDKQVNHVLHVHLKKGQPGAYVGANSSPGLLPEYEFILPRHTTLKVHPKPTVVPPHKSRSPYPTHVWHAYVVPNEEAD